jgi:hypothetical protein
MDKGKAVTAAAHKLARLFYALMTKGQEYVDQGRQYYEDATDSELSHSPATARSEPRHESGADRITPKNYKRINYLEGVS